MEKIFIVDDSILNLTVLTEILKADYETATFQDGADALLEATLSPPDLILLDIIMRGIDGFEVLERLKADPRTRDIPVIIITGLDGKNLEERALQYGAVDFITKPFRPRVVSARVKTHMELYRYRQNAERQAIYDGLTEIPNRRGFDRQFQALWDASRKEGLPFSAALADIDFFKGYNDHYGHLAGDSILRAVAWTLSQTVLPFGGFAARYGGEEYALLLPRFEWGQAHKIAEHARANVESLALPYSVSEVADCITLSIGGATIPPGFSGAPGHVLDAADHKLYEAKENGRNQVCWTLL